MSQTMTLPESHSPSHPKTLFGYDVIDFIGEGAASTIYAVNSPETGQLYALKHVLRKTDKDVRFIEQLEAEYEVGRRVNHPNLRKAIDLKYNKTLLMKVTEAALILELFDGQPLETSLPGTIPEILQIFIDTAAGLDALHKAGFVHCDLKPANILVDRDGVTKVIDLGQACAVGTVKKRIQGTPDYISPEQVKCLPCSIRTDVFNFGATLYWALTGRKLPTLFTIGKGENNFLVDDQLATPHSVNPVIPENLSNFVMECVRTNPSKRPADMVEVARRLTVLQDVIAHSADRAKRGELAADPD